MKNAATIAAVVLLACAVPSCESVDVAATQGVIDTARSDATLYREDADRIINDPASTPEAVKIATDAKALAQKVLDSVAKSQAVLDAATGEDGTIGLEGAANGIAALYPPAAPWIILGVPLIAAIARAVQKSKALASVREDAKSFVYAIDALRASSPQAKEAMKAHKAIIETNLTEGAFNLVKDHSST